LIGKRETEIDDTKPRAKEVLKEQAPVVTDAEEKKTKEEDSKE